MNGEIVHVALSKFLPLLRNVIGWFKKRHSHSAFCLFPLNYTFHLCNFPKSPKSLLNTVSNAPLSTSCCDAPSRLRHVLSLLSSDAEPRRHCCNLFSKCHPRYFRCVNSVIFNKRCLKLKSVLAEHER